MGQYHSLLQNTQVTSFYFSHQQSCQEGSLNSSNMDTKLFKGVLYTAGGGCSFSA